MYGWENEIKKNVDKIREIEIDANKRSQKLNNIEKSISMASVLIIASVTFTIINFFGSIELNSAKIFSTIEILLYVK